MSQESVICCFWYVIFFLNLVWLMHHKIYDFKLGMVANTCSSRTWAEEARECRKSEARLCYKIETQKIKPPCENVHISGFSLISSPPPNSGTISLPTQRNPTHTSSHSPPNLATKSLYLASMDGYSRHIVEVESYNVCPLWLASWSSCKVFKVHLCHCMDE